MAVNGLRIITNNGSLEAKIGEMINLRALTNNAKAFGVAIPLQRYTGALNDEVVFRNFKTNAEAAGFDNGIMDRITTYVEKMVQKFI